MVKPRDIAGNAEEEKEPLQCWALFWFVYPICQAIYCVVVSDDYEKNNQAPKL